MKLNITIDIDDSEIARLLSLAPPAKPVLPGLVLELGGVYRDRAGREHTLNHYDPSDNTFLSDGLWYEITGHTVECPEGDSYSFVERVS